jgi:hypothetical protein
MDVEINRKMTAFPKLRKFFFKFKMYYAIFKNTEGLLIINLSKIKDSDKTSVGTLAFQVGLEDSIQILKDLSEKLQEEKERRDFYENLVNEHN